nr:unnamed protein product [Digitaria exilis]
MARRAGRWPRRGEHDFGGIEQDLLLCADGGIGELTGQHGGRIGELAGGGGAGDGIGEFVRRRDWRAHEVGDNQMLEAKSEGLGESMLEEMWRVHAMSAGALLGR